MQAVRAARAAPGRGDGRCGTHARRELCWPANYSKQFFHQRNHPEDTGKTEQSVWNADV